MRFLLFLAMCCCALGIAKADLEAENRKIMDQIGRTLNGVESENRRLVWDQNGGFRIEDKSWQDKAAEWVNNLIADAAGRQKRQSGKEYGQAKKKEEKEEDEEEELIHVNAKIVFYRNGTRWVGIENGPVIIVDPQGKYVMYNRNGTVQQVGEIGGQQQTKGAEESAAAANNDNSKNRAKRFATLDDLYMAHGYGMDTKEANDFGRQMGNWAKAADGEMAKNRAEEEEEEEGDGIERADGGEGGPEWRWADASQQKDQYWGRPLYGGQGGVAKGGGGVGGGAGQPQQQQPLQTMMLIPPPAASSAGQNSPSAWEQFETVASVNGQTQPNGPEQRQPMAQQNGQQQTNGAGPAPATIIQPPAQSPSAWLKSRLESRQPLSEQELAMIKELLRRNGGGEGNDGTNGTDSEEKGGKGTTNGNGERKGGEAEGEGQEPKAPNWARPK